MDIKAFVDDWLATGNAFDTKKYLDFFEKDAVLDDVSVGSTFVGHQGIKRYFDSYFIGYNTRTKLAQLEVVGTNKARLEVKFTGNFPERTIGGSFNFTFKNDKIFLLKADLIH